MAKVKVFEVIGSYEHQSYTAASGHLYIFDKRPGHPYAVAKVYNEADQKFFEEKKGDFAEVTVLSKLYSKVKEAILPKPKSFQMIAYKTPKGKKTESITLRAVSRQNYLFLLTSEYPYPVVKIYDENKEDIDYFLKNPDFFDATKDILKQRKEEEEKYKKYTAMKMNELREIGKKYGVNDNDKAELAREIIAKQRGN